MFLAEFFERGALNHRVFCSLQYLGTTEPRLDPVADSGLARRGLKTISDPSNGTRTPSMGTRLGCNLETAKIAAGFLAARTGHSTTTPRLPAHAGHRPEKTAPTQMKETGQFYPVSNHGVPGPFSDERLVDACNIGHWYIEMFLLSMFRYRGEYWNLLTGEYEELSPRPMRSCGPS